LGEGQSIGSGKLIAHKCSRTVLSRSLLQPLALLLEFQPALYRHFARTSLISISDAQREPLRDLDLAWAGTVYHGLPLEGYPYASQDRGYLAFLGRIAPEKQPDVAIEIARRAGVPLKIAAKVDAVDREYFERVVAPLLDDPLVEFIGEIGEADKAAFLGGARALLFTIDWPEPFGLVMIEAMACGTPVLAFRHGSVPEVIDEGVTGVIVDTMDEAVRKLPHVLALDRRTVRRRFDQRFTATRMAKEYVQTYRSLLKKAPASSMREVVPLLQPALEETVE